VLSEPELYCWLAGAALLAGLLDAIVGGGGLIQVPALFSALPTALPSTLFATNKLSGVFGTALAARTYSKTYPVDWSLVLPASAAALVFGALGAWAITMFPPEVFRKLLPFILIAVALYVFRRKDFGGQFAPTCTGMKKTLLALGIGGTIGLYDGFFGPGTGSFLIFLFIRTFGLDFLRASAAAKIVNVSCNLAALAWFIPTTEPFWLLAGVMAVSNMAGSLLGTRLALREGAGFVRQIFLLLVLVLIAKTGWDAFGSGP
jgi:uncharacterized membrane protein YfcA